ncbi:MAG: hypothetical protein ACLQRH_04825 [Acidimicrobiales bacterium]
MPPKVGGLVVVVVGLGAVVVVAGRLIEGATGRGPAVLVVGASSRATCNGAPVVVVSGGSVVDGATVLLVVGAPAAER